MPRVNCSWLTLSCRGSWKGKIAFTFFFLVRNWKYRRCRSWIPSSFLVEGRKRWIRAIELLSLLLRAYLSRSWNAEGSIEFRAAIELLSVECDRGEAAHGTLRAGSGDFLWCPSLASTFIELFSYGIRLCCIYSFRWVDGMLSATSFPCLKARRRSFTRNSSYFLKSLSAISLKTLLFSFKLLNWQMKEVLKVSRF